MAPVALLLLGGCAHSGDDRASTTTVTSGATSGVKVTNTRTPQTDELAVRIATELCGRERACDQIRTSAQERSDEACMAAERVRASEQLSRWACRPTAQQAGFASCLEAIRLASCDAPSPRVDVLPSCQSDPVCTTR